MKNIVRNLAVVSCISSSAFAAPFLAIGDNAELFLTGTASVRYDDNILLLNENVAPGKVEDEIFELAPGFELKFGKDSLVSGILSFSETFSAYSENQQLNEELANAAFRANYANGKTKLGVNASYVELFQNTVDVNGATLVRRDLYTTGVDGEVALTEKTKVGTGFSYEKTDYHAVGYFDSEVYSVPANFYYELTPKVDLSTGIRYRNSDIDLANADSEDYYFNVGARGEFTAKLNGRFSVGYNKRKADLSANDDSGLGLEAGLVYLYSQKTQFGLDLSKDFSSSSSGASQENSRIGVTVATDIAADWKANAGLSYRFIDYSLGGREDEYYEATVGATYVINSYLSVNGSYLLRLNESNTALSDFSNNVVSLSISARY